jgi:putative endonuclease
VQSEQNGRFIQAKDEEMTNSRQELGKQGEALAREYLMKHGYIVRDYNWRSGNAGELDIIAQQGEQFVFVEVRTRYNATVDDAFESITPRKRDQLIKLVHLYLNAHNLEDADWRIDVIAVAYNPKTSPVLDHMVDALDW